MPQARPDVARVLLERNLALKLDYFTAPPAAPPDNALSFRVSYGMERHVQYSLHIFSENFQRSFDLAIFERDLELPGLKKRRGNICSTENG